MVNYYSCCFVQIISNTVITPPIESCLSGCKRLNTLFVLERLKISVLFVMPPINAFKSFSINQKLMPFGVNTSTQVVINSQINSNSLITINRCFYLFILIDVLNLKPSSGVFWMYSHLLNFFVFKSFWQLNFNFAIFLFKLARHGNIKIPIFELDSRNNQREITFFGQVTRQLWCLITTSNTNSFEQAQERFHASIYHSHSLLSNIGIKQSIILIHLADMVVRFIGQTFSFSKEILSALVQCHIKKILTQATQRRQGNKFLLAKSSELIFLSGVHFTYFRDTNGFVA